MRIAGLAIMLVAFPLLTVARVQLGDAFSVTPQARQLVTHGLYSRIRNPVYVFGLLGLFGVVLYVDILTAAPAAVSLPRADADLPLPR
jgi:protein-S-isoprenylcysteine O-methyltransferase Ste14